MTSERRPLSAMFLVLLLALGIGSYYRHYSDQQQQAAREEQRLEQQAVQAREEEERARAARLRADRIAEESERAEFERNRRAVHGASE